MSGSTDQSEQAETISHTSISEIAPCFNGNISESLTQTFANELSSEAYMKALHAALHTILINLKTQRTHRGNKGGTEERKTECF